VHPLENYAEKRNSTEKNVSAEKVHHRYNFEDASSKTILKHIYSQILRYL
jgi:hypothetical protein